MPKQISGLVIRRERGERSCQTALLCTSATPSEHYFEVFNAYACDLNFWVLDIVSDVFTAKRWVQRTMRQRKYWERILAALGGRYVELPRERWRQRRALQFEPGIVEPLVNPRPTSGQVRGNLEIYIFPTIVCVACRSQAPVQLRLLGRMSRASREFWRAALLGFGGGWGTYSYFGSSPH